MKPFCVYHHCLGDKLVYIGKGVPSRPYTFTDRTARWNAIFSDRSKLTVKIVSWFDTEEEALAEEKKQIKELKPPMNGRSKYSMPNGFGYTKLMAVKVDKDVKEFFKDEADRRHVNVSWLIRFVLVSWIDEQKANGRKRAK